MADFGSPVVQSVDPNSGLQTLSGLFGLQSKKIAIRKQQQDLETGRALQQEAQARAQQETQTANQRAAIANVMKNFDPTQHVDSDGTLDLNAVLTDPKLRQAAGDQFPAVMDQMIKTKSAQLGVKQQLANLNGDLRNQFATTVGSLRTDPDVTNDTPAGRAKVQGALQNFGQSGGPDAQRIAGIYGTAVNSVPSGKLAQTLSNFQLMAMDAGRQASAQGPNLADTGATLQDINPQSAGGNLTGQRPIPKTTSPTVTVLPSGSLGTVGGQYGTPPTAAKPTSPTDPRTAADDAPPPNAPRTVQDAYANATKQANDHVDSVRTADESYGNNKAISSAVRRLAAGADTGPGTETWNHVMGVLGTKGANNYQELGAFLDRQAATVRGQMGLPGTNAGAEDAKMIAGNTKYNAKVIQDKNDYTEALTDGLHMYRNGLDRIAGFGGQASPSAVAKFKSEWTNAFDPNVLIGENAYKRSKAEGDAFVKSLPSQEAASLLQKRKEMQALSAGQLPQ